MSGGLPTPADLYDLEFGNEGYSEWVYPDDLGIPTVGIGHNLPANGPQAIESLTGNPNYNDVLNGVVPLTSPQVQQLYENDMNSAIAAAGRQVSNFAELPQPVQMAIVDMVFNMGEKSFSKFTNLIAALEAKDFDAVAAAMEDSKWFSQVKDRSAKDETLVVITAHPEILQDIYDTLQQAVDELMSQAPDFNALMDWSGPDPGTLDNGPQGSTAPVDGGVPGENQAGPGDSQLGLGDFEGPAWDGEEFGDPGSYSGYSTDGYSGGMTGEGSAGGSTGYGEGGSWGGGEAGSGESGGQFGGGEGGYEGEGGYGGYGGGGDGSGDGEGSGE